MPHINLGHHKRKYNVTVHTLVFRSWYNTPTWKRLAKAKKRANPLCENCLLEGRTTATKEIHHIKPMDVNNPDMDLCYDWDNLQSLCANCHRKIQDKLRKGKQ